MRRGAATTGRSSTPSWPSSSGPHGTVRREATARRLTRPPSVPGDARAAARGAGGRPHPRRRARIPRPTCAVPDPAVHSHPAPFGRAGVTQSYSIGLLHGLPEPEAGYGALAPLIAPGGRFVEWRYAREGNGWVLALVDPVGRLTSRLPLPLVSGLAWVVTVPLWIALRLLYAPARTRPPLADRKSVV